MSSLEEKLAAVRARARAKLPARAAAIRDALDALPQNDTPEARDALRRLAHKLRGIAETPRLRAIAEKLELGASEGSVDTLRSCLDELDEAARAEAGTEAQAPVAAAAPAPPAVPSSSRTRALVVDDEESILRLTCLTLERLGGLEVVSAQDEQSAVHALREDGAFDLVLLDAMMPNTTGLALCQVAREVGGHGRVVILSAATPEQLGWSWPEGEGPDAWWQKPMPAKTMVARVRELLAG